MDIGSNRLHHLSKNQYMHFIAYIMLLLNSLKACTENTNYDKYTIKEAYYVHQIIYPCIFVDAISYLIQIITIFCFSFIESTLNLNKI